MATSIVLNVLADYAARVAGGLASWPQAVARFDPLALAVLESAPLCGLAFALASLLHRLAEAPEAELAQEEAAEGVAARNAPKTYGCKRCGAEGLTFAELGRHARARRPSPSRQRLRTDDTCH